MVREFFSTHLHPNLRRTLRRCVGSPLIGWLARDYRWVCCVRLVKETPVLAKRAMCGVFACGCPPKPVVIIQIIANDEEYIWLLGRIGPNGSVQRSEDRMSAVFHWIR